MNIDLSALVQWVAIVISLASLICMIIIYRSSATAKRLTEVESRVNDKASKDHVLSLAGKVDVVEDKVTVIQNDLKHLPDKDATHRLEMAIGDMRTEMRGLSERVKPISAMADRIQEAILEKVVA